MIRPLRSRHRVMTLALAPVVLLLLAAALAQRTAIPSAELPREISVPLGAAEGSTELAFARQGFGGAAVPGGLEIELAGDRVNAGGWVVYCGRSAVPFSIEATSRLLGEAFPGRRVRLPLPDTCRGGWVAIAGGLDATVVASARLDSGGGR